MHHLATAACTAAVLFALATQALAQLTSELRAVLARCGPIGTFTERTPKPVTATAPRMPTWTPCSSAPEPSI